jgi:hypothetical protein
MPHRRSRAEETGSTTLGGTTAGIHHAGTDEATHCGRVNEEITGEMHSPTADYCHPEQSHGSYTETTVQCRMKPARFLKRLKDKARS